MSRQQNVRRRRKERAETAVASQAGHAKAPPAPMAVDADSPRVFMRRDAWAILALALLVAASYWPATQAGFVWDDAIVTGSDAVRRWSGLWEMWSAPGKVFSTAIAPGSGNTAESHYWPVTYTSFWLEHKLWGFHPTGYHVVNILLHLANTLLLLRLTQRLAIPGAWLVAAVFAVHPLHVESVAWVIERKDLLSALFYLTAVLVWLRFEEAPDRWRYALVLVLFVAGMLAKSIVVTLPAALLILAWWKRGRVTATDLARLAPLFAVGLAIALADLAFYRAREAVSFDFSLLERGLLAARLLWFYAGKLLWPADLAVIYALPDPDAADPAAWGYAVAALSLAALLWFARRRIGRGPLAGALFFAVTLAPVLGFVGFGYMQFSFAADRFQYLAGIGVIALAAGAAARGAGRLSGASRKGALVLALAVLAVLGMLTWRQSGVYRDDVTFFSHIVSLNPQARIAWMSLGRALLGKNRLEESLAASRIAVGLDPGDVNAHNNAGLALDGLGRFDEAERHYRRGLESTPRHTMLLENLATSLRKQERHEEALELYGAALESSPDFALSHTGMGLVLLAMARYEEAIDSLERAAALQPGSPEVPLLQVAMGQAAEGSGRLEAAAEHYERALATAPRHPQALAGLSKLRFGQERFEEALALFRTAIEVDSGDAHNWSNQGVALYHLERYDEALRSFDRALSIDPDLAPARTGRELARERIGGTGERYDK